MLLLAASLTLPGETASAQEAIVSGRDAVVTGFSGMADAPAPSGADPLDYRIFPPQGPSARVVDLSALGGFGMLSSVPKPLTVNAAQVGQVFGVALDDAPAPSIYLAATSAYGLAIGVPEGGGIKRVKLGAPGAAFLNGQFGPENLGGGPNSIWRVDGTTGQTTLFADIGDDNNAVAGLGGLAFDRRSQQIFVADRATGLIHRLGLDGSDRGTFDHGSQGRPAEGLPEVPLSPVAVNIQDPSFDTEQPASWGFTDPERLIFGLATQGDRLFYAVAAGPEIWSVGILPDGGFANDPRFEVSVPTLRSGMEVASIAFDAQGQLYAAERSAPTGDYGFRAVADGGDSRILRFRLKTRPDDQPGLWAPVPDQYSIGLTPEFRNADGGVALGQGYDNRGRPIKNSCGTTVWSTGERLLGDGPSIDPVDGLQGNDRKLVAPANTPPAQSWFVDYDDQPGDPTYSGHMGAVVTLPCQPALRADFVPPPPVYVPPRRSPPPYLVGCPVGTELFDGVCLLPPRCPPGTNFRNGYCVAFGCPPNMFRLDGVCVPPPRVCDRYETFFNGRCVPWDCPRDMVRMPNGYCGCPRDEIYMRGQCIPPRPCPRDMIQTRDGRCLPPPCPDFWQRDRGGRCIPPPQDCRPPMFRDQNGRCVPPQDCRPPMFRDQNGRCVPPQDCRPPMFRDQNGRCVPPQDCRPPMFRDQNGRCVPPQDCRPPMIRDQNGRCVPPPMDCRPPMFRDQNGRCVLPPPQDCVRPLIRGDNGRCICPPGMNMNNGRCLPPVVIDCKPGFILRDGRCVPGGIVPPNGPNCNDGERLLRGRCVPIQVTPPNGPNCRDGERLLRGRCVPIQVTPPNGPNCKDGERLIRGRCVPTQANPNGPRCNDGERLLRGRCVPIQMTPPDGQRCNDGERLVRGRCLPAQVEPPAGPRCNDGERLVRGRCIPAVVKIPDGPVGPRCGEGERLVNGRCIGFQKREPQLQQLQPQQQQLDRKPPNCRKGFVMQQGRCVPPQNDNQPSTDDQGQGNPKLRVPNMRMMPQMQQQQ